MLGVKEKRKAMEALSFILYTMTNVLFFHRHKNLLTIEIEEENRLYRHDCPTIEILFFEQNERFHCIWIYPTGIFEFQ